MANREELIKEISIFLADKLIEMSNIESLPELPFNGSHFERTLMELENSQFILEYQASLGHGYRIQFDMLPPEEQEEGVVGVFILRILSKDPVTGRFLLAGEKRIFIFPSQVMETIKEESIQLSERAPTYYKLMRESQFDRWEV